MEKRHSFLFGQLPITISQPVWAEARGRFVAGVIVGGNRHSAEGKTPERAAQWLRVRLAGLFAYADACRAGVVFLDAARSKRLAMRAAIAKARAA